MKQTRSGDYHLIFVQGWPEVMASQRDERERDRGVLALVQKATVDEKGLVSLLFRVFPFNTLCDLGPDDGLRGDDQHIARFQVVGQQHNHAALARACRHDDDSELFFSILFAL